MNFEYLLALLIFCILFIASIYLMKYVRNVQLFNLIFLALVYIPYVSLCIFVYKNDTDPNRWNFFNTLPTANVSPFMFSITPLLLILPKKIKEYLYLLIAMLSVGMFLSTLISCAGNAIRNYKFHFHFTLDYLSHFALSAFGIFLIRTKQVKLNLKNCIISSSIIIGVATVMLVLNLIFDTSFFGLSLNGKHNIYNIVLVNNSYLSALLYYLGLTSVLFFGFISCKIFAKDRFKIASKPN